MSTSIARTLVELHPSNSAITSSTELHTQRQRRAISNRQHTRNSTVLIQTARTTHRIRLHRAKGPTTTDSDRTPTNRRRTQSRHILRGLLQHRPRHKRRHPGHSIIRSTSSHRNTSSRLQHNAHTRRHNILRQHSTHSSRNSHTSSTINRHLTSRRQRRGVGAFEDGIHIIVTVFVAVRGET